MNKEYQGIRLRSLDATLPTLESLRKVERPALGWLRSVREGLGLSLRAAAKRIGVSAPTLHEFEKNEASGALTLRNLERAAASMGCRVIYLLVPGREGQSFSALAAGVSGDQRILEDAEHSMRLEGQGVGDVTERAKRGLPRHGQR